MIVSSKQLPDFNELFSTLSTQFPDYVVYPYYSLPKRSIVVRKSTTVGAQINLGDDEIRGDACCLNIFISALIGLVSNIFPSYNNFEMSVTDFLKKKYD